MDPFFVSLISGGCAGTATDLVFFPIDTIKTRLQAKGGFFANGGWKGIYNGLGSVTIASAPSASLFFITYDGIKKSEIMTQNLPLLVTHMVAASFGEIAACLVRVPCEVIKQRTQTCKQGMSSLQSLQSIIRSREGIMGLYRGWSITIFREIPFTVIQFPLYEWMKKNFATTKNDGEKLSLWRSAICGSIAGGIAAALTTPLDVIKTRIMLHNEKVSIAKIIKDDIIAHDGYKGFIKGIGPRTMWISAGGSIFLGVYEVVSSILSAQEKKIKL